MKLSVIQNVEGFSADVVLNQNGAPIDLSTATGVTFKARSASGVQISRDCIVLDAAAGLVRLTLLAADTKVVGPYRAIFEVRLPGSKLTVPNTTYVNYQVIEGV